MKKEPRALFRFTEEQKLKIHTIIRGEMAFFYERLIKRLKLEKQHQDWVNKKDFP